MGEEFHAQEKECEKGSDLQKDRGVGGVCGHGCDLVLGAYERYSSRKKEKKATSLASSP
jgi:hypothetical protein